jgi:hypothetical protein
MYVLWHDYIGIHAKSEVAPHTFQRRFANSHRRIRGEGRTPMITAEGHEVSLSGVVETP